MPKYKQGDIVLVDGMKWEIRSWPSSDQGFASLVRHGKDGGEVWNTVHVGQIVEDGEPIYSSADVELVRASEGPVRSTLNVDESELLSFEKDQQSEQPPVDPDVALRAALEAKGLSPEAIDAILNPPGPEAVIERPELAEPDMSEPVAALKDDDLAGVEDDDAEAPF